MDQLMMAREEIDAIDRQMAALFERRMAAAAKILQYKKENDLAIFDSDREQQVAMQNRAYLSGGEDMIPLYDQFITHLMNLSKQYQASLLKKEGGAGENQQVVPVTLKRRHYDIVIDRGALGRIADFLAPYEKVLVVTDDGVPQEYLNTVLGQCKNGYTYVIPQGEQSKNIKVLEGICRQLQENQFHRTDCLITLGGGVVGDVGGFAAAIYMRGISLINIPTTTLAQIDSSIGGKVAINLDGQKNAVGTFYQPNMVIIDPDVLRTLPQRHYNSGLVEAVKAGIVGAPRLFELFETEDIGAHLEEIISRALLVKKAVVEVDERGYGPRAVLNLGHTIGHAVETACGLSQVLHGEGVAIGMLPMIESEELRARLEAVLKKLEMPLSLDFDRQKVLQAIRLDKKALGEERITIVTAQDLGAVSLQDVLVEDLHEYLLKEWTGR